MKEIEFRPKTEGFEGHIKIKLLNYKERMELTKELGLKVTANGVESDMLAIAEKMSARAKDYVTEVKLKFGDVEFSDLEELSYYKEGNDVLQELMNVMMNGMSLGKN